MIVRKLVGVATLMLAVAGSLQLAGCNCGSNGNDDGDPAASETTTGLFGSSEDGNTFDPTATTSPSTTSSGAAETSQGNGDTEPGNEPIGSPCEASAECESGVCATWYSNNKHGNFGCEPTCIEQMDEARWCRDSDACCDAEAECTPRGYCQLPGSGTFGESGAAETGDEASSSESSGSGSSGSSSG